MYGIKKQQPEQDHDEPKNAARNRPQNRNRTRQILRRRGSGQQKGGMESNPRNAPPTQHTGKGRSMKTPEFKLERLANQLREMSQEDHDELRQAVYKIADGYQALKQLKTKTSNPDVQRLFSDLNDIYNGSLEYFLKVM
jgi:hypothetical protein